MWIEGRNHAVLSDPMVSKCVRDLIVFFFFWQVHKIHLLGECCMKLWRNLLIYNSFWEKKKKNKINEFILKRIYFRGLVDIVSWFCVSFSFQWQVSVGEFIASCVQNSFHCMKFFSCFSLIHVLVHLLASVERDQHAHSIQQWLFNVFYFSVFKKRERVVKSLPRK